MEPGPRTATTDGRPSRSLVFAMACASGIAVANIYYNQPMLGLLMGAFPSEKTPGLIPTVTQLGYAAGLFFLVPLGDRLDRRRLIVAQFLALCGALLAAALAPTGWALLIASALIGIGSTAAQQVVPLAASLAADKRRGAVIGGVMSGLLSGILLSRIMAGFVASHWGWRTVFWLGVPLALAAAGAMGALAPGGRPASAMKYPSLLGSLFRLWREESKLRRATLIQGMLFASFSAFWTILALHLQRPPFSMGADIAGLFGVLGLTGIFAAPVAGRIADRMGSGRVVTIGTAIALSGWLVAVGFDSLLGLAAGVVLIDFGIQSSLIANQHLIYGLRADAKNRVNTLFMVGMFMCGSLGSAGALVAWRIADWRGVGAFAAAVILAALLWGAIHREGEGTH